MTIAKVYLMLKQGETVKTFYTGEINYNIIAEMNCLSIKNRMGLCS